MNWDKIKNFVIGGAAAAVLVAFMGFVDWRIGVKVDEAIAALDIGTDTKIIAMDQATATNTTGVAENKEDNADTKQQLRDVARVLMQAPE